MLQNSPTTVDQAKSGKNRIRTSGFLNQYSAPVRNLEKNFFARELKIVLQHNRRYSGHREAFEPEASVAIDP